MENELFPVVDHEGNVIGSATRKECHSGSMLLHPVVHLHILTRSGKILLQKRSLSKDIQPGKWDTAVGGHVDLGETTAQALRREAREELSVDASGAGLLLRYVFCSAVERELVHSFYISVDESLPVEADPGEIDEVRFWSIEEIRDNIGKDVFTPNFELEFEKILPSIISVL